MTPFVLTLDSILADHRENLDRSLRAGRGLRPGSAWIYVTGEENPKPCALVLRTPKLADLMEAARADGILASGIAAMSWTPLITQVQRVLWLWVELRNEGGFIFTAPIRGEELGDWQLLMNLPPQALHALPA